MVDDDPRFHLEALRWFTTLTEVAGVEPADLVVHAVGTGRSEVLGYLGSRGVTVETVERFDPRSPHCNKISGALRLAEGPVAGTAVLCDTDVVVLEDPRSLALPPGAIGAKRVDAALPPLAVLLGVFDAAGVDSPPIVPLPWDQGRTTVADNFNGGLYLVPGPLLAPLAEAWADRARWLLDRVELLAEWSVHVDQVAMALALADRHIGAAPLDVRWNTPTHDPSRYATDPPEPAIIHYHQQVDRQGRLLPTGVAPIDRRVAVANAAFERAWPEGFCDATFRRWRDERDERGPEPGSPAHRRRHSVVRALRLTVGRWSERERPRT